MKRIKLTFIISFLLLTGIKAQESTTEEFIPSGNPSVKIFTNAHSTFIDGENKSAFDLERAYFGYNYSFSKNFSTKIILDVGDPKDGGNLQMTAFLKNAALIYQKDKFTTSFGLIGLYGFKVQEKHWGYRYIYKSLQDEHKFGSSADLGASFMYKFTDLISVDMMILNGEGYKNLQSDDTYKGALGVTISPIKNFDIRAYYDLMSTDIAQQTIALFTGYKADKFRAGAEYNYQINNDLDEDQDLGGISVYSTVIINKKINIFGRFDNLTSSKLEGQDDPWNIIKDGQTFILGIEYIPVKGVKIAPNFQGWSPSETDVPFETNFYLNVEISF
ncbi:porin [Bacteroidota bacterium]